VVLRGHADTGEIATFRRQGGKRWLREMTLNATS
jgi:hypothetical protein